MPPENDGAGGATDQTPATTTTGAGGTNAAGAGGTNQGAAGGTQGATTTQQTGAGGATNGDETPITKEYAQRLRNEAAAARSEAQTIAAERDELKKYREDREAAELKEQKEFEKLANIEKQKREDAETRHAAELGKRDARIVSQAVRSAAVEAGIIDPDLATLIPKGDVKIDATTDDVVGAAEAVAAYKAAKPGLFKDPATTADPKNAAAQRRTVTTPDRTNGQQTGTNWNEAKPEDVRKELQRFGVNV
jgi:hypothetical protein